MSSSEVIDLNTEAVSLLTQGRHEESHLVLRRALESFRAVLKQADEAMEVEKREDELDSVILHAVSVRDPPHECVKASRSSCENSIVSVYSRAFIITSEREHFVQGNEHTVPAVLLYNMGLGQQLVANRSGKSSGLRRAMQLYNMSFAMLEEASHVLNDMDIMVLLALANNMSIISGSQFYDRNGAESSRLLMDRILSSDDCLEALNEEDIKFFSLNLMFLSEYEKHAQAPAA